MRRRPSARVRCRHDANPLGHRRLRRRLRGQERPRLSKRRGLRARGGHAAGSCEGRGLRAASRRADRTHHSRRVDSGPERRRRLHRHTTVEPLRSGPACRGGRQAVSRREADGPAARRVPRRDRGLQSGPAAAVGGLLPARPTAIPARARLDAAGANWPGHLRARRAPERPGPRGRRDLVALQSSHRGGRPDLRRRIALRRISSTSSSARSPASRLFRSTPAPPTRRRT